MIFLRSVLVAAVLVHFSSAACVSDNCYNNLNHHSASTFCSTYTTTVNTASTGLPTYIPTECNYSRLSSACSCLYPVSMSTTSLQATTTTTTTVTVTSVSTTTVTSVQPTCILRNGDFGLDPWVNEDIINESSYGYNPPQVAGPGYNSASAILISFPGSGIYELDQFVTFPAVPTHLTLQFYAKSSQPFCSIFAAFGAEEGNYYAQGEVELTSTYAAYSISGITDGNTFRNFVALEVNCQEGSNNQVYIDAITLM